MERLLIVDGSNLLFQMFYGMPARIVNADGKAIQGTLGFVGALLKILRMVQPDLVAVIFDGPCQNVRRELDGAYKANRPDYSQVPQEENPFSQLPDIYDALDFLGICHAETESCEADDWIAGYAIGLGTEMEVIISSFDSDFFQLITHQVKILRYRGKCTQICDRDYVQNRYGITPEQYADFKALAGDTADNIRGAARVGPKTAAWLLHQFGSLDGVLERWQEISRPCIRESIRESSARLRLNQCLIRLQAGEDLPFAPEDMVYTDEGFATMEVLQAIGLR